MTSPHAAAEPSAHAPVHAAERAPMPSSAPEAAPENPFAPAGIEFQPVSSALIKVRLTSSLLFYAVVIIGFTIPAILFSPWFYCGTAAGVIGALWSAWLIPRSVRAKGYALAEDHLLWRSGVMFRSVSVVPYGRMQFVDTSQGPIARHFGIASVSLHTASASTDATIDGLPVAEAERLRQILSERGEEKMAGL